MVPFPSHQGRIGDGSAMHPRERRKGVRRRLGRRHDVAHLQTPHDERVGNQLPVALPPLRFGAHDRDKAICGKGKQCVERLREFAGLHVVGIASKTRLAPSTVRRIATRLAETPESREMSIDNSVRWQRGFERLAREMRMTSRPRNRADVGQAGRSVPVQQEEEFVQRTGRMSHRQDAGRAHPTATTSSV